MANDMPKMGWVGLGNMGYPMAKLMVEAGYEVTVLDLDRAVVDRFVQEVGGKRADTLAEVGRESDVAITMVPDGKAVHAVAIEGGDNLSAGLADGTLVIDMSSSAPTGTVELGAELLAKGVTLMDAPVSGGVPRATDGTLAIMLGGDDEAALTRATPILEIMGGTVFRTGRLGSGHAMKCLNNYLSAIGLTAANEALIIGAKFGLDPSVMTDIINQSTGRNSNTERKLHQCVLSRTFDAGFSAALMAKDVRTAAGLADDQDMYAPVLAQLSELWTKFSDEHPGEDHTASVKLWEEANGFELKAGGAG